MQSCFSRRSFRWALSALAGFRNTLNSGLALKKIWEDSYPCQCASHTTAQLWTDSLCVWCKITNFLFKRKVPSLNVTRSCINNWSENISLKYLNISFTLCVCGRVACTPCLHHALLGNSTSWPSCGYGTNQTSVTSFRRFSIGAKKNKTSEGLRLTNKNCEEKLKTKHKLSHINLHF